MSLSRTFAALRLTGWAGLLSAVRSRDMKPVLWCVIALAASVPATSAFAEVSGGQLQTQARGTVCLAIDEARDTFSPQDRQAALILVAKQFELAGRRVVPDDCAERYLLSHVGLGNTITVTLSGAAGQREAMASGLDDLPGLYSQLVRALLTGSAVGAMNVVDRTNVTTPQAEPKRVSVDSFGYARLGYGSVLGSGGSGNPVIGFGYRAEMDSFGLDVSFLNQQLPSSNGTYGSSGSTYAGSLLKLEGLYFTNPRGNRSAYFGGGLGWGAITASSGSAAYSSSSSYTYSSWSGSGLQGELTAGYELPRASDLRVFVQTDATLPFYRTTARTTAYSQGRPSTVTLGHRYNPSIALSVGLGWQRHRR
jgi:hypothetical protein